MSDNRRRVKLYALNADRQWDDRGTGHVSSSYIDRLKGVSLIVKAEVDGEHLSLLTHFCPTGLPPFLKRINIRKGCMKDRQNKKPTCKKNSAHTFFFYFFIFIIFLLCLVYDWS